MTKGLTGECVFLRYCYCILIEEKNCVVLKIDVTVPFENDTGALALLIIHKYPKPAEKSMVQKFGPWPKLKEVTVSTLGCRDSHNHMILTRLYSKKYSWTIWRFISGDAIAYWKDIFYDHGNQVSPNYNLPRTMIWITGSIRNNTKIQLK